MNPIEFARNLFSLRMERKMTVEDLAEALGVSPEVICEWECAKTSPSLDQMNRLAKLYGIPLDEVIRNPKPHEPVVIPVKTETETPEPPAPAPEPEESVPEPDPLPKGEQSSPPRRRRRKKVTAADWIVISLLLAVIAIALYILLNPEMLPLG